jgi:type II secretory pathway pseudopilin PulG
MISNNYFIELFKNSSIVIELIWVLIAILLISIIAILIYLKFLRTILRRNEKSKKNLGKEFETNIITYLYSADEDPSKITPEQQLIIEHLKKETSKVYRKDILIATMLKLTYEISGEMANSINKLYIETGLLDHSIRKVKTKKWNFIAQGIRELTLFEVKEVEELVKQHINHPRIEVRSEIQLYLVNLFHFNGLDFLNEIKTPISEWDQIQLLEVLQLFKTQEISGINTWLKSSNESVVIFSLKMAKIYNRYGVKDELLALLDHPSLKVRIKAINVMSHLTILEAKPILKQNFEELDVEEQIAFFSMLENIYEATDKPFILDNILNPNFEIKFSALKILKELSLDDFNSFKDISPAADFVKIINHLELN